MNSENGYYKEDQVKLLVYQKMTEMLYTKNIKSYLNVKPQSTYKCQLK